MAKGTQRDQYAGIMTDVGPALLKQSYVVDLVQLSPLLIDECWLVQGFPHGDFEEVPIELAAFSPSSFASSFSIASQRALTGNAMRL